MLAIEPERFPFVQTQTARTACIALLFFPTSHQVASSSSLSLGDERVSAPMSKVVGVSHANGTRCCDCGCFVAALL
jgi:hypothetical protein